MKGIDCECGAQLMYAEEDLEEDGQFIEICPFEDCNKEIRVAIIDGELKHWTESSERN